MLTIFLRTVFFYFFLFVVYRIMGKREVGKLSIIDLIVSILIAELVVISIENYDNNIWNSLIPIITLAGLQVILALVTLRLPKIRTIIDGSPSIIIKHGKVNFNEMLKQKYNLDDLLVQLRDKGYRSIEEIEYALLETNGTLSVFGFSKNELHTPLPVPLILDSKIQQDALKDLKKDEKWVKNILDKKNIKLKDIFYAFYKNKSIFIIKNSDLE